MSSEPYISILIPDGESHLTIQVIICLSRVKNYRIHVLSSVKTNEIRFSRYVSTFAFYPDLKSDPQWISAINSEVSKYDIDVIMPVFETGIRRLLVNKNQLSEPGRLVLLPPLSSFDIAIDKWKLYLHCSKHGISCPKTWLYESTSDVKGEYSLPLVVKPTTGFGGGMGITLLRNREEWEQYFSGIQTGPHSYLLQEYIEGIDYSCSVLCEKGEIRAYTIQRSESGMPGHFGPQMAYQFERNEKILELCTELMQTLNWSGIASVDIRYDRQGDAYKILEVNTRFWRSLVGSLHAGINFPHLLARQVYMGNPDELPPYEEIRFFDLKGFAGMMFKNKTLVFNGSLVKKSTPLLTIWRDPAPFAYKFINRTRNILMRKFSK